MSEKNPLARRVSRIRDDLAQASQHVFSTEQLRRFCVSHGADWGVAAAALPTPLIKIIESQGIPEKKEVRPEKSRHKSFIRYLLFGASPFDMALSLRPRSYLTCAAAVFLHGITDQLPKVIHANQEPAAKAAGGSLPQAGIDRAFSGRQRVSA